MSKSLTKIIIEQCGQSVADRFGQRAGILDAAVDEMIDDAESIDDQEPERWDGQS